MLQIKKKYLILFTFIFSFMMALPISAANFFDSFPKRLARSQPDHPRILMIGNSLTYTHNIDSMLKNICQSNAIDAEVHRITKGGHALFECMSETDALHDSIVTALSTQKWDYVILQGRAAEPVENPAEMLEAIKWFEPQIKSAGAQMVLYMTWVPENSANLNAFQSAVSKVYYELGNHFNCAVAPSGIAFARARDLYPSIDLHYNNTDRKHPSVIGSYLSACTIYATLFNRSPYGTAYYPAGRSPATCAHMQAIAEDVTVNMDISSHAKLNFSSRGYSINKGKSLKLSYTLNRGARVIGWTSANQSVAAVSSSGTIKGVSNGRTTITALLNNNTTVSCEVIVTPTKLTMGINEKYTLEFPGKYTWTSSKSSVAGIKKNIITASKKGTTVLTGRDSSGVTIKISVTVKGAPTAIKAASSKTIYIGRQSKLSAAVKSGVSFSKLTFKSSNPGIVSVDKNGILTGKRVGKAKITIKSYNGKKAVCTVHCVIPAQKIWFKNASSPITLKRGKTKTLKVGFAPSNTTIKTIKWKSSNKKIVSVSSKGKITALKKGTATVSATTTDGTKKVIKLKIKVK
ncbi:MAG: Ig-like domain-containing protein [Eubacteriales bacterium]|nr:Ig-like domain-containing protein [Eubacteriales bacterium]